VPANEHTASAFLRAPFYPIDILAIDRDRAQAHALRRNNLR
jgi:hypothetical protein